MRCCGLAIAEQFAGYIFDVDGTLVDSAADICGAVQSVLIAAGRADLSHEYLRSFIGRHLFDLWQEVFPACSEERMEELLQQYRCIYLARKHAATKVYRGVKEGLSKLRGKKSTATTKSTETTRSVLGLFELLPYFDNVQGTDGFPAKPNPDVLYKSAEGLGLAISECLFVGDSPADMEAARRAGMKSCAVSYGYGKRQDLQRWEPVFFIDDLRELVS
jgi:2-phosphoglycolate phosphatase